MVSWLYVVLSLFTCGAWTYTQATWLRWLAQANGTRPFIMLTLGVGWVMFGLSVALAIVALVASPLHMAHLSFGILFNCGALVICSLTWSLHSRLHAFVRSGESE